jgi:hypothetical protein
MRRILFSAVVIFFAWLSVVFASQIGMIPFSEKISNSKDIIAAKVEKISRTIGPWLQPEHQVLCTVLKTFKGDLKPGEQVKWRFIPGFESGEPSELRPEIRYSFCSGALNMIIFLIWPLPVLMTLF